MLISKQNLAILPAAAKPNISNYAIEYIHIDPENGTVNATNGHSLYCSDLPDIPDSEYPEVGANDNVSLCECSLLPVKALVKAGKNLPKRSGMPLSILRDNIQFLTDDTNHNLITTDLDTTDVVKTRHSSGKEWPDYMSMVPKTEQKTAITLSTSELEILVKVLKGHGAESVSIELREAFELIVIKTTGLVGYIMPRKV